jgi:DNA-binding IclR family transcriptional regulator
VSELARDLGVAPSTAHHVLAELQQYDLVVQAQDRRYALGPAALYVGAAVPRAAPIVRAVWSPLVEIARELKLSAAVATPWDGYHLILAVDQHVGDNIAIALGGRVPEAAGSWGKALYAWGGRATPAKLPKFTPQSMTDLTEYRTELEATRSSGFAVDEEEFTVGVGAVASAITSREGCEGIASLIGPIGSIRELGFDRVGRRLAGLAARASQTLGDDARVKMVGKD